MKYLRRAVANPSILFEYDEMKMIARISALAAHCHTLLLHNDAQHYFKRIKASKLVPVDLVSLYLASSYFDSGDTSHITECHELVAVLYCKRSFDNPSGVLEMFKEKQGKCFREAMAVLISDLSNHYYVKGQAIDSKGDELTLSGNLSGEY